MISALVQNIRKAHLTSLRLHTEKLVALKKIDAVIFIGSSLTGKTTLVDAIRKAVKEDSKLALHISVPKRIVTRPKRKNENLDENEFVSRDKFDQMVKNREIEFHAIRRMEGLRTERYGFLPPKVGSIPVYSANNAIINDREYVTPGDLLGRSLIIAVYAPENIRKSRLPKRSPDLIREKPEEVEYRISDKAINMLPYAHIVVENFGENMNRTKKDLVELMKLIIKGG